MKEKLRIENNKKAEKERHYALRKEKAKHRGNKIMEDPEWMHSPVCYSKICDRIREDAIWGNYLLYYPECE